MVTGCGPSFGPGWYCSLSIDAEGNALFEQTDPKAFRVTKTATMTSPQMEEVVAAINRANIWVIEDQRNDGCQVCVPIAFSIVLNGRTKSVSRDDAGWVCRVTPPGATPEPGTALCELRQTIDGIASSLPWDKVPPTLDPTHTPLPTYTPILSSAKVVVTVYMDRNGDGTPQPSEGLPNIPVQLALPDGKILSATTQQDGTATFDMSGYETGIQITASLPNLYRSHQFYLPQRGNMPIMFAFAQPAVPSKIP